MPFALISCGVAIAYTYKTEIENNLTFLKSDVITQNNERVISKKLSGLLDFTYKYGKMPVGEDSIDV